MSLEGKSLREREIENRRSVRKYKPDEIERKLIEEIIYSASLAPSAKTGSQLTVIVAVGFADEAPDKRPRKPFEEIVEYR